MVRLEFLKYMAALAAMWRVNPIPGKSFIDAEITKSDFGKDFNWGVATSAYQIEGAWNADGKGESVWDRFTSRQRNVKDKTNCNETIDFYNRSESDLKLLKSLNFKNFRFSFSWARILPDGTGRINEKGLDFYNRLIDTCLDLGLAPKTGGQGRLGKPGYSWLVFRIHRFMHQKIWRSDQALDGTE